MDRLVQIGRSTIIVAVASSLMMACTQGGFRSYKMDWAKQQALLEKEHKGDQIVQVKPPPGTGGNGGTQTPPGVGGGGSGGENTHGNGGGSTGTPEGVGSGDNGGNASGVEENPPEQSQLIVEILQGIDGKLTAETLQQLFEKQDAEKSLVRRLSVDIQGEDVLAVQAKIIAEASGEVKRFEGRVRMELNKKDVSQNMRMLEIKKADAEQTADDAGAAAAAAAKTEGDTTLIAGALLCVDDTCENMIGLLAVMGKEKAEKVVFKIVKGSTAATGPFQSYEIADAELTKIEDEATAKAKEEADAKAKEEADKNKDKDKAGDGTAQTEQEKADAKAKRDADLAKMGEGIPLDVGIKAQAERAKTKTQDDKLGNSIPVDPGIIKAAGKKTGKNQDRVGQTSQKAEQTKTGMRSESAEAEIARRQAGAQAPAAQTKAGMRSESAATETIRRQTESKTSMRSESAEAEIARRQATPQTTQQSTRVRDEQIAQQIDRNAEAAKAKSIADERTRRQYETNARLTKEAKAKAQAAQTKAGMRSESAATETARRQTESKTSLRSESTDAEIARRQAKAKAEADAKARAEAFKNHNI
jgi:hypothetical protein